MIARIAVFGTKYHKAAAFSLLLIAMSLASADAEDEKTTLIRTLNDYAVAFNSLDPQRAVPYYHEPLLTVSAERARAWATRTDVEGWVKSVYHRLKERGWEGRYEYTQVGVRKLSADLAEASALYVRYKPDGQELDRQGMTYILRKTSGEWKIAVLVTHDAGTVRSLD